MSKKHFYSERTIFLVRRDNVECYYFAKTSTKIPVWKKD